MENKPKTFRWSEDEKSFASEQQLPPSVQNHPLEELDPHIQQLNVSQSIQVKYYQEYKKIYLTSYKLWFEICKQSKIKENMVSRLSALESKLANFHKYKPTDEENQLQEDGENESKRKNNKRMRRTAEEIERKFVCTADFCDRCYGSQGSLQQHIKLKHPQLYKKEVQSQYF